MKSAVLLIAQGIRAGLFRMFRTVVIEGGLMVCPRSITVVRCVFSLNRSSTSPEYRWKISMSGLGGFIFLGRGMMNQGLVLLWVRYKLVKVDWKIIRVLDREQPVKRLSFVIRVYFAYKVVQMPVNVDFASVGQAC